ncbi:heparinase II/III family protein [Mycolicibacterium helvum]|uniref:heparinase II/III family protein n=1 Tax=Mycolicibacterium helvum TaxID=1534349 RepID=UPI0013D35AD4|nr:alginate lyase family protein [Mycolicibacterium helvum]
MLLDRERAESIAANHREHVSTLLAAADAATNLSFQFFGYPRVQLVHPVDWNHDPISDLRWPSNASRRFARQKLASDVKWIWELNRLQHLPLLAQAWLFTGDARYSTAAFDQLDSWIDQNPTGQGIAWCGAFEAGIRAISIAIALQGLREAPELTPERFQRIVGVLGASANRCWHGRSLFSSANNHLIGEMAGLAVVAMMFPEFRDAKRWERQAIQTLSAEAPKQLLADGAGSEQAISYQMFTVELLHLVAVLAAERGDDGAPDPIVEAIERSSFFLASLIEGGDPAPRYGDDDGGFALRLGVQPVRTIRDHLGIVAGSGWGPGGATASCDNLDAQWYRAASRSASNPLSPRHSELAVEGASFVAPHGGLAVLRDSAIRTMMDIGPLGYLSIAAHGHADALAVTVSADGEDIISDPGTGSYHGHADWRAVMRGTRAHSTVCVDGQDQSVSGGPFLWSEHARVTIRGISLENGVVDAQHDGYKRLAGGVVHRRWLISPPGERARLVVDLLTGTGRHTCSQNWPLHPAIDVETNRAGHLLSRRGAPVMQLLYAASAATFIDGVFGDSERNWGWWSDRLERRTPTWWLSASCDTDLPLAMVTLMTPTDGIVTEGLSVQMSEGLLEIGWEEDGRARSTTVSTDGGAAVSMSS